MEIEAKLTAPSLDVLDRISVLKEVGGYFVSATREHHIRDVYFDTPGRALLKQEATLRLRLMDGEYYTTFKADNRAAGAVHRREEVEERLPHRRAFLQAENPLRPCQHAKELAGNERLRPTLIVRNHRRALHLVAGDGRCLRLLLDHVIFVGKGGRRDYFEIEIEGEEEDSSALEGLAGWLQARFPLTLSGPSKYATGLALVNCART